MAQFLEGAEINLFSKASTLAGGPFQRPIQWVSGSVPVGKAVWLKRRTISVLMPTLRMGIYISHIRLHGVHRDNCNYLAVFTTIYRRNI